MQESTQIRHVLKLKCAGCFRLDEDLTTEIIRTDGGVPRSEDFGWTRARRGSSHGEHVHLCPRHHHMMTATGPFWPAESEAPAPNMPAPPILSPSYHDGDITAALRALEDNTLDPLKVSENVIRRVAERLRAGDPRLVVLAGCLLESQLSVSERLGLLLGGHVVYTPEGVGRVCTMPSGGEVQVDVELHGGGIGNVPFDLVELEPATPEQVAAWAETERLIENPRESDPDPDAGDEKPGECQIGCAGCALCLDY